MKSPNYQDLTGIRFNRLTAIERAGSDNQGHVKWLCQKQYRKTYKSEFDKRLAEMLGSDKFSDYTEEEIEDAEDYTKAFANDAAKREALENAGKKYTSDFDKVLDAVGYGINYADWYDVKLKAKELEAIDKDGYTATDKAEDFAVWLDEGDFTGRQKDLLREQFGFYAHIRGDATAYDALTAAGFNGKKADGIYDAVSSLSPRAGSSGVTNAQKCSAINGLSSLSESEKFDAIKAYFPPDKDGKASATVRRYATAADSGYTVSDWTKVINAIDAIDSQKKADIVAAISTVFPDNAYALYKIYKYPSDLDTISGAKKPSAESAFEEYLRTLGLSS